MSAIRVIKTTVNNEAALRRACERLGVNLEESPYAYLGKKQMAALVPSGRGYMTQLSFVLETGDVRYDSDYTRNPEFDKALQDILKGYSAEMVHYQAGLDGNTVYQNELENGDIELLVEVG
jgi:hypothetical protein